MRPAARLAARDPRRADSPRGCLRAGQCHLALPFALLALALSAQACRWAPPVPPAGAVLFQDDFARNSGGWSRHDGPDFWAGLDDGWYRLRILQPNTDGWSNPGLSFGDVRVEVEAVRRGGPEDNLLGVICRYQDGQDFYFLVISSDGYAGIGKLQAGQRRLIGTEALLPSPAVARGNASNHLTAECVGDRLRLSVNSVLVAEGRDPAWSVGDVGLLAGASAQPGVDVAFDNFSVLQPGAKDSP